jgi:hypothetical protein
VITSLVHGWMFPMYECEGCGREVKYTELVRQPRKTTALAGSGEVSYPVPVLIGTASFQDGTGATSSLTIPNITLEAFETMVVITSQTGQAVTPQYLWGSEPQIAEYSAGDASSYIHMAEMFSASPGTNDLSIQFNVSVNLKAATATAYRIRPRIYPSAESSSFSAGSGSGTAASSNTTQSTPTISSVSVFIAAVAVAGPSTDTAGSWGSGFSPLLRHGTNSGIAAENSTIAIGYRNLNGGSSVPVSLSGFTSRAWALVGSRWR